MIASAGKAQLFDRMLGAALLEQEIYQEAALSASARPQAVLAVLVCAAAAAFGSLTGGFMGFVVGGVSSAIGWVLYVFAAYWMATTRFMVSRNSASWSATWRTLALANSPRVFLLLAFLPAVGFLIGIAAHGWVLIATVVAVRTTLDLESRPALAVAAVGTLPMLVVWVITGFLI